MRAGVRHAFTAQRSIEDLGDLGKALDASPAIEILEPQPAVVILVVARADADVETPSRNLIDRQRLPGEDHRVPHGDIGYERADPDPLGISSQRGKCGPRLQDRQLLGNRLVGQPDGVEPDPLSPLRVVSQLGIGQGLKG
jgi:hypothetical protein